jgi:hypothetical protein
MVTQVQALHVSVRQGNPIQAVAMKPTRLLWVLFLLGVFASVMPARLVAQPGVIVVLHRPPPNQLRIADLWIVDLTNMTNQTLAVHLHGTVDEATDGRIVEATTRTFSLPPGFHRVTGNDIQPVDAKYDERQKRYDYKTVFLRTSRAPTGDYTVCIEVIEETGDTVAGSDCYDQQVQVIAPPILVAPFDESTVADKFPNFSWLPPVPVAADQSVRYSLKIVEVLGRQTPYDALTSNPAYFTRSEIPSVLLQYPVSARPFIDGRQYAWQIKAFGDGFPMGESEIWWFTYDSRLFSGDTTDGDVGGKPIGRGGITPIDIREPGSGGPSILLSPITLGGTVSARNDTLEKEKLNYLLDAKYLDLLGKKSAIPQAVLKELLRSCGGP